MYSIIIVEDEYLVRQGIASLVDYEQFGMQVIAQAENGIEAWQKFQENPADILLTDINMPQMNGLELAKLVRDQAPKCHIVFLTGYDDFDYARTAIKLGADDYLLKPFSKDDVEEMLAKVQTKLDKERKKAQIQNLVDQGQRSELEEAIHARLADSELSLKNLALQLGFSPSYLSVLIKKELGLPFQDYLIQERMKKAKLLLLTTDLKIYEIAEQVGFEDMNYFSQRFKQVVGLTPRQFKKGEEK
ncbi:response regulator transcription factor [Streptococcus sanguinis]|uniref:response regulator transcription factor n=1 Tax=Streptococcus sanguinis TaxID=1305 RepID=UPI00228432D8|nr:response regulator [Streptococcus sanguinis]MCY7012669.1 response regulator [Streptococcus sanguinis]